MPLICIALLSFLLLPRAHSCDKKWPLEEKLSRDYGAIIKTDIYNTGNRINVLLQNCTCPDLSFRRYNCTLNWQIPRALYNMACKMRSLGEEGELVFSVQNSVKCSCYAKLNVGFFDKEEMRLPVTVINPVKEHLHGSRTKPREHFPIPDVQCSLDGKLLRQPLSRPSQV